jgi:hypothetical protein
MSWWPVSAAEDGPEPTPGPAHAPVTGRGALAQAVGEQFSLEKSLGGVQGMIEAVVPITVFSVLYGITHDLRLTAVSALVPSVGFATWRLIRREPLTQALSGVFGVGLGAFLAVRTGRSENFFLPSIIKNAAYGAGYMLSIALRWPVIGVILGLALAEGTHWRRVPQRMRVYRVATWIWVGMFGVRLLVQIPLFLAGQTAALGFASIPLGLPLFAVAAYLTWLVVRRVPVARLHPEPHSAGAE